MRLTVIMLVSFLASASATRVLQQAEDPTCSLTAVGKAYPEISSIATVLAATDILGDQVPRNMTLFLPNNVAVDALLTTLGQTLGQTLTIDDVVPLLQTLPILKPKLISALLYHIVTYGAYTLDELVMDGGDVVTALSEVVDAPPPLTIAGTEAAGYTLTDATGAISKVIGGPVVACGSNAYVIDKVLMPAPLLEIPDTTPEEARQLLSMHGSMNM